MKDNQFDNRRKIFGAIIGPLLAIFIWWLPFETLSVEAHHLLAIMSLVAVWWITEPVAIPVTSLLGPTLCVLVGVAPVDKAFSNFANPLIFLRACLLPDTRTPKAVFALFIFYTSSHLLLNANSRCIQHWE